LADLDMLGEGGHHPLGDGDGEARVDESVEQYGELVAAEAGH